MKTIILAITVIYFLIAIPESHAGVAGVISWLLNGECDEKEDENGVLFCSTKDGEIYYVYDGIKFKTYPDLKKD